MSAQKKTAEAKNKQQHKSLKPQVATPQSGFGDVVADVPALSTVSSVDQQVAMLKKLPKTQQQVLMGKIGQTQGNGHVQRLVASMRPKTVKPIVPPPPVQPKMEVNDPDDQYEQEADQVADAVMRMPAAAPPPEDGEEPNLDGDGVIQAKGDHGGEVAPETAQRINSMRGSGHPLPDGERQFFEERMGADFSGVRIHTDSNAVQASQEVQAKAFTTGNDIAFNEGEYRPERRTAGGCWRMS